MTPDPVSRDSLAEVGELLLRAYQRVVDKTNRDRDNGPDQNPEVLSSAYLNSTEPGDR